LVGIFDEGRFMSFRRGFLVFLFATASGIALLSQALT